MSCKDLGMLEDGEIAISEKEQIALGWITVQSELAGIRGAGMDDAEAKAFSAKVGRMREMAKRKAGFPQ